MTVLIGEPRLELLRPVLPSGVFSENGFGSTNNTRAYALDRLALPIRHNRRMIDIIIVRSRRCAAATGSFMDGCRALLWLAFRHRSLPCACRLKGKGVFINRSDLPAVKYAGNLAEQCTGCAHYVRLPVSCCRSNRINLAHRSKTFVVAVCPQRMIDSVSCRTGQPVRKSGQVAMSAPVILRPLNVRTRRTRRSRHVTANRFAPIAFAGKQPCTVHLKRADVDQQ